ncbi:hypothetical protein P409_00285 [Inquilinus limosus MP06]|uniref:Uncharacterized protein n=2 Tax=Inquilinus limosus TaxID=171674 RepID=A0A0A0DDJ9_9PROT|nr:hypothetical protein P409_00285 [Inquilinus limosus MP06]
MGVGGNAALVIKSYVDRRVELAQRKIPLKAERKDEVKNMKDAGLPAVELIALSKRDDDKLAEKAERLTLAGSLLGIPVYAGEVSSDRDTSQDHILEASLKRVLDIDEELKEISEDEKALNKAAKGEGFSVYLIDRCVQFRLDPDSIQGYRDDSALFEKYWEAATAE